MEKKESKSSAMKPDKLCHKPGNEGTTAKDHPAVPGQMYVPKNQPTENKK